MAASGKHVYMTWLDRITEPGDGLPKVVDEHVVFRRSTDGGVTFEERVILSNETNVTDVSAPVIAASGSTVFVAWHAFDQEIARRFVRVAVSTDNGKTFDRLRDLNGGAQVSGASMLDIAASGDTAYVVWDSGNLAGFSFCCPGDIYFRAIQDDGTRLGPVLNLSVSPEEFSGLPVVAASQGNAYVAWQENGLFESELDTGEIWFRRVTANGSVAGDKVQITSRNSSAARYPRIAAVGQVIFLEWNDLPDEAEENESVEVFFDRSFDGGRTFHPAGPLNVSRTPGHSTDIELVTLNDSSGTIEGYVVWTDTYRNGSRISLRRFNVGRETRRLAWHPELATNTSGRTSPVLLNPFGTHALLPAVAASESQVFVAWSQIDDIDTCCPDRGPQAMLAVIDAESFTDTIKGTRPFRLRGDGVNEYSWSFATNTPDVEGVYVAWEDFGPVLNGSLKPGEVLFAAAGRTFEGTVELETPDRGVLPLRRVKVDVVHAEGNETTFTDENGHFRVFLPRNVSTGKVRITLADRQDLLEVHYRSRSEPAFIETETLDLTGAETHRLRFSATDPELTVNGAPITANSSNVLGFPANFSHLAGVYYYALIAFDFIEEHLPGLEIDDRLPLEVVGLEPGGHAFFTGGPEPTIHLGTIGAAGLADDQETNFEIFTVFHEMGHYIMWESRIGGENDSVLTNPSIHPELAGLERNCHQGYAQNDSSCAWSEGFATFMYAVMADAMLTDSGHSALPVDPALLNGYGYHLEAPYSVVGPPHFTLVETTHLLKPLNEEMATASLLWDLYDSRSDHGDQNVQIPIEQLWPELTRPANNPHNEEIISNLGNLYFVLSRSGSLSNNSLNAMYAARDICVDSNGDLSCSTGEDRFGLTSWSAINSTGTVFEHTTRLTPPPVDEPWALVIAPRDDQGNELEGVRVDVHVVLPNVTYNYTVEIVGSSRELGFYLPNGSNATLTFRKDGHEAATVNISFDQYIAGVLDTNTTQALELRPTLPRKNTAPDANDVSGKIPEDTRLTLGLTGSDAEGDPLTFSVVDPPAVGQLGNVTAIDATSASATYTPPAHFTGRVSFTVVANDGRRDSEPATVNLTYTPVEDPPVADAGDDQTVDEGVPVRLNASDSSDPDGDALAFAWTQVEGPAVTLSDPSVATPSFDAPEVDGDTVLAFRLEVTDESGRGSTDAVRILITDLEAPDAPSSQADLAVSLSELALVQVSEELDQTVTVTNAGPDDARNVTLTYKLPPGVDFVSASSLGGEGFPFLYPAPKFSAGNRSEAVAVGDLNSDGILDVLSSGGGGVFALFGDGAGTFREEQQVDDRAANSMALADLNEDGDLDFVTSNGRVFLGNGDGTFNLTTSLVLDSPASISTADVNGDGRPDLVTANGLFSNDVSVLLGNGDGTFQSEQRFSASSTDEDVWPVAAAVEDLDGDGHPDIVTANVRADTVSVLLGHGNGTFDPPKEFETGGLGPNSVAIGDLDGDGIPDVGVSHDSSRPGEDTAIAVLFGSGNGTLQTASTLAAHESGVSIRMVDMDDDGSLDLVTASPAGEAVALVFGNGNGTFQQTRFAPVGGGFIRRDSAIAIRDMDDDDRLDVVVSSPEIMSEPLMILFGAANRSFVAPTPSRVDTPGSLGSFALGDLNGDSILDAVINQREEESIGFSDTEFTYRVTVFFGNGDGTFTVNSSFITEINERGGGIVFTSLDDLNGDGELDLVQLYERDELWVRLGNGDGKFGSRDVYAMGGINVRIGVVADLNRDGIPDVVSANGPAGTVSIRLGQGDGTFGAEQQFTAGEDVSDVATADVNGDSVPDLVATDRLAFNVSVLLGDSDGSFQLARNVSVGDDLDSLNTLAVEDLNGDSTPDIVAGNLDEIFVLVGDGAGGFDRVAKYPVSVKGGNNVDEVEIADVDDDGSMDVLVESLDGTEVFLGDGEGRLQPSRSYPWITDLHVADVNGDEGSDLIGGNDPWILTLLRQPQADAVSCTTSGDAVTCDIGTLRAGDSVGINVSVRPTVTGPVLGAISATSDTFDGNLSNNLAFGDTQALEENDRPVADAGPNRTVNEGEVFTLNGSASSDPDGDVLGFDWTQVSGPDARISSAAFTSPSVVAPEVAGDTTLVFELRVSDGQVVSDPDKVAITVRDATNEPPVANAGPDKVVLTGSSVTLNGTSSSDPDGDALSFNWRQVAGPGVSLSDAGTAKPSFTAPAVDNDTRLTFELVVSDGAVNSTADTVTVFAVVPTPAPFRDVARFGPEGASLALAIGPDGYLDTILRDQPPAFDVPPTPPLDGPFETSSQQVEFPVQCSDPDSADSVQLFPVDLPTRANFTPTQARGNPATGEFIWKAKTSGTEVAEAAFICRDEHGSETRHIVTIDIVNRAPTVAASARAGNEGEAAVVNVSFTDPDEEDTHRAVIRWDDGTTEEKTAVTSPLSLSHVYGDDGEFHVNVTVIDDNGNAGSATVNLIVSNLPPVVDAGRNQTVAEGATFQLAPAQFDDPGELDTHVAEIDWGDGTVETGMIGERDSVGTVAGEHVYGDDGVFEVRVTVCDDDGACETDSLTVTVQNVAPELTDLNRSVRAIDEGGSVELTGTFIDPGILDSHRVTVRWGDGTEATLNLPLEKRAFSLNHTYSDNRPDDAPYPISVRVVDKDGGEDNATTQVTVLNVAPNVRNLSLSEPFIKEGNGVTISGEFIDPGVLDTHEVVVDWGDGSNPVTLTLSEGDRAFSASHPYLDNPPGAPDGTYPINVAVIDKDGGVGSNTTVVQVLNVPPNVSTTGDTIDEGETATVQGNFIDPGILDTHTATVDWGDGTPPENITVQQGTGFGNLTANHTYGDDGEYTITVTVKDNDGGVGNENTVVEVSNVAPIVDLNTSEAIAFHTGQAFLGRVGVEQSHEASATDPGSDDLTFAWNFEVSTESITYFNDGQGPDPDFSPGGTFPFSATDTANVTYDAPGVYVVEVDIVDDDGGIDTANQSKLVSGDAVGTRSMGFWRHQYSGQGQAHYSDAELDAFLAIVNYASGVYSERADASALEAAHGVLSPRGPGMRDKAEAQALAAWLNFAAGGVGLDDKIDTDGDGDVDRPFHEIIGEVESILTDPNASEADLELAKDLAEAINTHAKSSDGGNQDEGGNGNGAGRGN